MTDKLPPNLLALFQPRPPLRYLPPADKPPEERRTAKIDGVAAFVPALLEKKESDKDLPFTESWLEKRDREKLERQEKQKWLITKGVKEMYKPFEDPNIRGDPYKSLFVGRLPYDCVTKDLEREFGRFGPIERVRIVTDRSGKPGKDGKPRGYAFILFERDSDMKAAYKETEHMTIRGRKVIVDVDRGRTVNDWRPRRFGGGLGGRHYTKVPARAPGGFGPPSGMGFRGGFRGGNFDRGGFRGGPRGGGFRGGGYGGRGGIGYQNGGPPDGAPAGPRQGGGFESRAPYGGRGGDRDRGNANFEPLPPRGGGYRDRDRDYDRGQKRPHEGGGGYDDSRSKRRY